MAKGRQRKQAQNPHKQQQQKVLPARPKGTPAPARTIVFGPDFGALEERHHSQVQDLWVQVQGAASGPERRRLSAEIYRHVCEWNVRVLRLVYGRNYFDLHYLTVEQACAFVALRVEKEERRGVFTIVTGRGKRSKDQVARIKARLLKDYGGQNRCHIAETANPGMLILDLF